MKARRLSERLAHGHGTNPWHGRDQPGAPQPGSPLRGPKSRSAWSREEALSQGRVGCVARGCVDMERGSEPRALASRGSFLPLPFLGGTRRQQPRPPAWGLPRKGRPQPLQPGLLLLGRAAAYPVGPLAPRLPKAGKAASRGGARAGAARRVGLGQKTEEGNRPLALFSASSLTEGDPLQVPWAWSTAAIKTKTRMCTHTRTCTTTTRTHASPHTQT